MISFLFGYTDNYNNMLNRGCNMFQDSPTIKKKWRWIFIRAISVESPDLSHPCFSFYTDYQMLSSFSPLCFSKQSIQIAFRCLIPSKLWQIAPLLSNLMLRHGARRRSQASSLWYYQTLETSTSVRLSLFLSCSYCLLLFHVQSN